ncbi:hypothetical protein UFOVP669_18 [uncultured Caudovirales phage]|uniref:Uncharacterized protein n=1 Tax=uncultured Caudovirales phage TaxID=2100421 RepID=A0A6J5M0C7_9CAUD|nr:hypothetical protein UFOVP400_9 [uncultured Caudovirales phage]CAB4155597.1 hypothetical protein UFOVP669_18 [uncultured Caudovirales phage]CAB4213572.1 hypothetical protein UFOVP1449_53 [uncultured Caudovirales phage]
MPPERSHSRHHQQGEIIVTLTDDQIDAIAEKAAAVAVSKMTDNIYREVGKSVLNKIYFLLGAMVVGLYLTGQAKGWWK